VFFFFRSNAGSTWGPDAPSLPYGSTGAPFMVPTRTVELDPSEPGKRAGGGVPNDATHPIPTPDPILKECRGFSYKSHGTGPGSTWNFSTPDFSGVQHGTTTKARLNVGARITAPEPSPRSRNNIYLICAPDPRQPPGFSWVARRTGPTMFPSGISCSPSQLSRRTNPAQHTTLQKPLPCCILSVDKSRNPQRHQRLTFFVFGLAL